ncbi:MAG: metal-dependent hydrolase [Nanoarchaeota archaeon]|nr:metal-dependent hydrolase [Nanoarchaeota archaeon]
MLFRTHLAFGILVFFLLNQVLLIPNKILFFIFVAIGAIVVDVDLKNSKVGKNILLRPFQFFIKHRGMVHSFLFGIVVGVLIAGLSQWAGFGFFAGFMSHLFLDFTTAKGIEFFWPWKKKTGLWIKTGGIVEEIFFVLILLTDFWLALVMVGVV